MKIIKWSILLIVVLLVAGGAIAYFSINGIVKSTIEEQASKSLELKTQLSAARLSLFGGKLALKDLQIASPKGFDAKSMFSMDTARVAVNYGQLTDDPIHIKNITLDGPRLVMEQAGGKFNFQVVMDQQAKIPPSETDLKLIIDTLKIDNATVVMRPGFPGMAKEIKLNLPALELKKVGSGAGNKNGAAVKDVVLEVFAAMVSAASESDQLPAELRTLLKMDVQTMTKQLGEQLEKKIDNEVGKAVVDIIKDSGETDPSKAMQDGLRGLMTKPATQPTK